MNVQIRKCGRFVASIFIALFLTTNAFSQSLRDYVCIVRGNLAADSTKFLEEIKDDLNDRGYSSYAKQIETYLKGSFGSGFVYKASDGKPYIITNKHVVDKAETANVSFENADGSVSEYKELKIIAVDEDIDVALLALPENYKRSGLLFRDSPVSDGEEVWSAGFPGLGTEPMWQLGRGSVTNARAKIKELLNPDISTIIQHSAQVDGGNSGGPLLTTASNTEAGYRIVGINTWKAYTREATNFSIPGKIIRDFVEQTVKGTKKQISIDDRVKQFVKSVTNKDEILSNLAKYISNNMISKFGKDAFTSCLQIAPSDVRNMVARTFASDPIEGLRYALVYQVIKEFWDDETALKTEADKAEESTAGMKVNLNIENKDEPINTLWIEEQGNWRLAEFSTIKPAEKKSQKKNKQSSGSTKVDGVEINEPYRMNISAGFLYSFESKKPGFDFSLLGTWNYVGFGFFLQMQKANVLAEIEGLYNTYEMRQSNMFSVGPILRLQVPISFHKFTLTPFGDVRFGFSNLFTITKDEKTSRLYTGLGGGLSFSFNVNETVAPFISAAYTHSIYKKLFSSISGIKAEHTNAIIVSIGVKVIER
ncbi:MAG: trypsin-like peptidase domain-containing protein [Treponema sp.]|nr:trypsin-like peptidase domain-containing protein [Treponema sp.]